MGRLFFYHFVYLLCIFAEVLTGRHFLIFTRKTSNIGLEKERIGIILTKTPSFPDSF
jgi:hypothetical protein